MSDNPIEQLQQIRDQLQRPEKKEPDTAFRGRVTEPTLLRLMRSLEPNDGIQLQFIGENADEMAVYDISLATQKSLESILIGGAALKLRGGALDPSQSQLVVIGRRMALLELEAVDEVLRSMGLDPEMLRHGDDRVRESNGDQEEPRPPA